MYSMSDASSSVVVASPPWLWRLLLKKPPPETAEEAVAGKLILAVTVWVVYGLTVEVSSGEWVWAVVRSFIVG